MHAELDVGLVSPGWAAPVTASLDFQAQPVPLLQPAPRVRRSLKPALSQSGADSGKGMLQTSSTWVEEARSKRVSASGEMRNQQPRRSQVSTQPLVRQNTARRSRQVTCYLVSQLWQIPSLQFMLTALSLDHLFKL